MEIIIDNKKHKIIYIEYADGMPFSVITTFWVEGAEYRRPVYWDFFYVQNDKKDIYAYESGSGGDADKIHAPQWADGYLGRYWMAEGISFKGTPKNAKQLKHPKVTEGYRGKSRNPFNIAEITDSYDYCEKCGWNSVDYCDEHKYTDDEGNDRWISDNSYIE